MARKVGRCVVERPGPEGDRFRKPVSMFRRLAQSGRLDSGSVTAFIPQ